MHFVERLMFAAVAGSVVVGFIAGVALGYLVFG